MENKAVFKFNNGIGALLCSKCSKVIKTGLEMTQEEWETISQLEAQYCEDCGGLEQNVYFLLRDNDQKLQIGMEAHFVEWSEDGKFKKLHKEPQVGFSCILDAHYAPNYTWLTTSITEITEQSENKIRFNTQNSSYTLSWSSAQSLNSSSLE